MTIRAKDMRIAARGELWLIAILSMIVAIPASAQGGGPGKLQPAYGEPCCNITGIDRAAGTATAKNKATGQVITFAVPDKSVLQGLRVGQAVYADLKSGRVSVNGAEVCCGIVSGAVTPAGPAQVKPAGAEACCNITGIDLAAGTATAKDKATGELLTFAVRDPALLQSLQVGQAVYADRGTQQVSVNGADVCCSIVSGVSNPVGPAQLTPAGADVCCSVVANAALTGNLGRLLVAFPAVVGRTRIKVYKSGEKNAIKSGVGSMAVELLPGSYVVSISNKRVSGVTIQAGHDTQVKVGVLLISAAGDTQVKVLDADQKTSLSSGRGARAVGLPVGAFQVMVAGQMHPIQIQEGQTTHF